MGNSKKITMKAFKIVTEHVLPQTINFPVIIHDILNTSSSVEERILTYNENDSDDEGDSIPSYELSRDILFGSFIHMKFGAYMQVFKEHLSKKTFNVKEVIAGSNEFLAATMERCVYFCVFKDILVINCGNSVKTFQTYLNWLFETFSSDTEVYRIDPIIKTHEGINLSDVKAITIGEHYFNNSNSGTTFFSSMHNIALEAIKSLIVKDSLSISDEELKNAVSAKILLRILKPKSKKEEDTANTLKALLKSTFPEDVNIKTKNHGTIKGDNFEAKKSVSIARTEKGLLHEEQLKQEMTQFIKEISKT